jgi:hypothetical protein
MTLARAHRRLSDDEFSAAAGRLRIRQENLKLARAVMVDGIRVTDLAAAEGITYQRISNTVKRIYASHLRDAEYPSDWRRITVTVPDPLAEQIQNLADAAAHQWHREKHLRQAIDGVSHATLDGQEGDG